MEIVDANEHGMDKEPMGETYCRFRENEGMPVYTDFYVKRQPVRWPDQIDGDDLTPDLGRPPLELF